MSPGAILPDSEWNEYRFNNALAESISCHLATQDHEAFIINKDNITNRDVAIIVNYHESICAIELHCNAFNERARGTETLYTLKNIHNAKLAALIQKALVKALDRTGKLDRGIEILVEGERGFANISGILEPVCLIEPIFMDNLEDVRLGLLSMDAMACGIAGALVEFYKYLRGAK
jgi:N-acetylmuramoyl-L-alanine amidase